MKKYILLLLLLHSLFAKERVVSLSPSITEILYALDAGEKVVATSSYSLYPPEAKKLPIVGGYTNPNLEKIISYSPTLVVGQSFNTSTLQKLHSFNINTLQLRLKQIKDIQDSIKKLGKAINKNKEAQKLNTNITNTIHSIQKTKKSHSVMIVYGLKEDLRAGIYIAGKDIFFNDIIELSGNINAYTSNSTSQPVLGYENVIALNPEQIIILHSHATEPNVDVQKALKSWYSLPTRASYNKQISVVDADYLHIPSHRVALTIEKLSKEMELSND